jgi:hypothetical protein
MVLELNHCMEVRQAPPVRLYFRRDFDSIVQEILRANAYVKTAADLATKYRKNVQYNLEATKGNQPDGHT